MINPHGILISALRGGSGKTILSVGITAAWKKAGKSVAPFKKGPDYIDAGWLALAAGRPCFNLDTFLISTENILKSISSHLKTEDIALVEGNRGLYDGIDTIGENSSAQLAKLLGLPVILCVDCTKSTRTMAAAVLGCIHFDPEVRIRGVILNRVAGARHEKVLRANMEKYCRIPVVGSLPKLGGRNFPERHMGLLPAPEHRLSTDSIDAAAQMAEKYLDLDALEKIAGDSLGIDSRQSFVFSDPGPEPEVESGPRPRIGIISDTAFQFYYPENIEALVSMGAEPVWINSLVDAPLPDLDALYIGGGFPETHAERLAQNRNFRDSLRKKAEEGLPVYAECGGLMLLGRELVLKEKTYPMANVFPIVFGLSEKPQGHGYTIIEADRENPFYPVGTRIRGHEFHYSGVLSWDGNERDLVFRMERGTGLMGKRDGICRKNVLASYTHIHALGTPEWARSMVGLARSRKKIRL